jgi:ATP phosphoribosyltransferase
MTAKLTLAMPSKGRLLEAAEARFERAGLRVERDGVERGYQGRIAALPDVEVTFLSAVEIAQALKNGSIALGLTGEDLLREAMPEGEGGGTEILLRLGFGHADVVVAVPQCWLDVATMADLDDMAVVFHARHGRRLKIATKYPGLTRRWFAEKGVTGYRIVESAGATEGAPASGTAEAIVDITTTGSTLKANRLKVLDDGVILRSQAVLAGRAEALGHPAVAMLKERIANSE